MIRRSGAFTLFDSILFLWQDVQKLRDPETRASIGNELYILRRLVRYDGRGTGLSQREVSDYSLDAWVLDLEAVVDRLGLERFALYGPSGSGPVAIAYAARHPERVQHLILWAAWARSSS